MRKNERFLKNVKEFHKTGKCESAEHASFRLDSFDKISSESLNLEITSVFFEIPNNARNLASRIQKSNKSLFYRL